MKKVRDMSDEELDKAFNREYKESWLRRNESRKRIARIMIPIMIGIILLAFLGFFIPMLLLFASMA